MCNSNFVEFYLYCYKSNVEVNLEIIIVHNLATRAMDVLDLFFNYKFHIDLLVGL